MDILLPPAPEWHGKALCAEVDAELLFPDVGNSGDVAKRICGQCEAKPDCLAYALEHEERFGIWAGTTPKERKRLLRRQWADLPEPVGGAR